MFEMLGDRCVECDKDMRVNVPHPHHIDPETTMFGVLSTDSTKYTLEEILEEIEKCELRCAVCHRRIHHKMKV
jgi:hypothetical protein